jgi:hypothetical protein
MFTSRRKWKECKLQVRLIVKALQKLSLIWGRRGKLETNWQHLHKTALDIISTQNLVSHKCCDLKQLRDWIANLTSLYLQGITRIILPYIWLNPLIKTVEKYQGCYLHCKTKDLSSLEIIQLSILENIRRSV